MRVRILFVVRRSLAVSPFATKTRRALSAAACIAVLVAGLSVGAARADAHTTRTVGPYELQVGWVNEPAYAGMLNSLELAVTDTRTNERVAGLEKTLKVALAAGGLAPVTLELEPAEDELGAYRAWVIPTATGAYTFHLTGTIGTQNVDEKFASGPDTFADVTSQQDAQYPTRVPQADELAKQLDDLRSAADQARLLAIAALAVAIIAIAAAVVMSRRRV